MMGTYTVFTFTFGPTMGDVELEAKLNELSDAGYVLYKVLKFGKDTFKFILIKVKP